ncbi:MAG: hypothetical protein P8P65_04965 [Planktotalea sp.]|uniref:hypothetical protein n=1 Tax=Planktotalea sp. TaxID=2029877 RepID=UPI002639A447|nr:hypothetical protein [Planktotalea sp.]MDG1075988.1 hypothetical protein [Planktotalea sp.]
MNGIAANDTLNIRAEPNASSPKLGSYPPFAINIEMLRVSEDAKWGMIGMSEGNGWVAMRYLKVTPNDTSYTISRPLNCSGTEPFWALNMTPRGTEFTELGASRIDLKDISEAVAQPGSLAKFEEGPTKIYTLMLEPAQCSDRMSDREFGFTGRVFIEAPDGNRYLRGYCTMGATR